MKSLDNTIAKVKNKLVRDILGICKKRKEYPRDCITDGALEKLAQYIVDLEEKSGT